MRTKPPNIDADTLAPLVEKEFGLAISSLAFLPEGEDSFAFLAEDANRVRHFLRLEEDVGQRDGVEDAYLAVETLVQRGLSMLLAPRRIRGGGFLAAYGQYLVSLFPFIEGGTLFRTAADGDRARVAEMVASLHETPVVDLSLSREGLENPFEAPIRRALSRAESPVPGANRHQERASTLLAAHREDVESSLRRMEDFRREQVALVGEWVLTHGEPHLANVLKDPQGRLYLTDCGDLAVGPPERDLFAFMGPDFGLYLKHYLRRRGSVLLNPRLFEFYSYRWALQEIADYATRILFRHLGREEDEHAWRELQAYLPTRHEEIALGVSEVREALARQEDAGRHA